MLYLLILTFILSKNISADSADLVKKASKIKACKVSSILLILLILLMARRLDFTGFSRFFSRIFIENLRSEACINCNFLKPLNFYEHIR